MIASGSKRIGRLAEELRGAGIDAIFTCTPISMGYLNGFHEGGGERFLTLAVRADGTTRMICPGLSATQARRSGIEDVRSWKDGEDPLAHFRQLAEDWNLRSAILAVEDDMPAYMLLQMQEALPAALFKPGQEVLAKLMRVKEPGEIELMRRAGKIADEALPAALRIIRPGVTELDVEEALMSEMRRLGGRPLFCIVATGANGAEPHHMSDETKIADGDVIVLDFGCTVDGYLSDITRTVCCGSASDEAKKVYDTVLRAHNAGRAAINSGVACQDVDRAARRVIEGAGYGEFFMHRTGHGIGMRGHEEPFIIEGNALPLAPGHCFSVEPGIYLPGKFGVRIENIVTCTENGHESLNAEPAGELIEC
ncbi:MAG: Xaa-Pro peptidase family protein [Fimbriimonadaceae bacterium]